VSPTTSAGFEAAVVGGRIKPGAAAILMTELTPEYVRLNGERS
jgi:hypothetical protein